MTWRETAAWIMDVLSFPLFELEGFPISLGKLIFGLFLFVIGLVVSKRLANEVDRRIYVRLNLDESLRYTFRRLTYYFFLFLSVLFILRLLHVPLTVFTVLGGAAAVGVGFGSQNIFNNFISGLLVMAERPIRVGDYIEVDGVSGRVQIIGIRSTWVRTLSNALMVIPNTTFIEKKLTNWTLSGTISTSVQFVVGSETDTEKLKQICRNAVEKVPGVAKDPEPSLSFVNFGDAGLVFDLGYNIESASFPKKKSIESEVRYSLNSEFIRAGLKLPCPQRDIQLRPGEAIPVVVQNP